MQIDFNNPINLALRRSNPNYYTNTKNDQALRRGTDPFCNLYSTINFFFSSSDEENTADDFMEERERHTNKVKYFVLYIV